jgi:hypothetical protein
MPFDAELFLLAMAPVFLASIGWQAWHLHCAARIRVEYAVDSSRVSRPQHLRYIDRNYAGVCVIRDCLSLAALR